ncbi:D-alanine--D-alanine ligase family protein [Lentzea sp. NBRC 102530]|uniref:D-alanine--D-alanine ligase family protein n=1 Tax=Lentzea sp. NBRC 102530 TaxID=3032201 RepID=UPI0024A27632|nr:D-alanine--D-alanine ligase family protein [Lentzea sp. NBRC 102530]GLY50260.1 D-alanine--D-alanine ligase [Lentzea sp. NBRC 102530]
MSRVRIGVLFGGAFEEHPVSVKSAGEVARGLDPARYEPFWIKITRGGDWLLCDGPDAADGRPVVLCSAGLVVLGDGVFEVIGLDVVFPVLHGRQGEDGSVQGLLELAGIPYVGCDVQSSALCMDKTLTYVVARSAGVATPRFWTEAPEPAWPVFVKPARSGSSFGVTKVSTEDELAVALDVARQYDAKVVIEEAVEGQEIGCAILGTGDDLVLGELDRVALTHGFFRIHQEDAPETGSENSTFVVPADISARSRALVRETAQVVYRALGCSGLARVDLFLTPAGEVVLNEVNTMPGLTSYSRYPRMMAAAGLPLGDVIDRLVSLALTGKQR